MPRPTSNPLPQPVFDEPVFTEGPPTPDPTGFRVPHPSDAPQYAAVQKLLDLDAVGFPAARGAPSDLYGLAAALGPHGPEYLQQIAAAQRIVFHTVGDIGASSSTKYPGELSVADHVTADVLSSAPANRPAFLYLLGDLVYDFGEAQYYYDQFYEPYRNYPGPIFAIPGNHDSFVLPGTAADATPLDTFQRNFCAAEPTVTPEAGSLHRTAMCQPGVYFSLDAPFVRIIGLFSNALEDPGVISSESGKWSAVPDTQLEFLAAQLQEIKQTNYAGAVLLATHHPPFSYAPPTSGPGSGGSHGSSAAMLRDIDAVCAQQGVYPHAFLAGHAHNYQRYTRTVEFGGAPISVPFVVAGGGGHGVDRLVQARAGSAAVEPTPGADVSYLDANPAVPAKGLVLDRYDDQHYGYLRVTVDAGSLALDFYNVAGANPAQLVDSVAVALPGRTVSSGGGAPAGRSPAKAPGRRRTRRPSPSAP